MKNLPVRRIINKIIIKHPTLPNHLSLRALTTYLDKGDRGGEGRGERGIRASLDGILMMECAYYYKIVNSKEMGDGGNWMGD